MVGTSDLKRSVDFYDAILAPLGLAKSEVQDDYVGYAPISMPDEIEFYVTKPFNQEPPSAGNGTMIALGASSLEALKKFHSTALEKGGTDEGAPGPRDGTAIHYAYVRDYDGNKICAFFDMAS